MIERLNEIGTLSVQAGQSWPAPTVFLSVLPADRVRHGG